MLSRPLPTPVSSGTHTSRRATGLSLRHLPATRGASARRGATAQTVWQAFADWSAERTQSGGGGRGPGQDKQTGGGGDPEGRPEAPRGRQAVDTVATYFLSSGVAAALYVNAGVQFINSLGGVMVWYSSMATKADVTEAKNEVKERVDEKVGEVKKSVDRLTTFGIGLAVIMGIAGVGTLAFFAGRKS